MNTLTKDIGNVTLTVELEYDYDTDLSWIGKWSNRNVGSMGKDEKLVHVRSMSVMDCYGVWRNAKGQFVPEPEEFIYSRDYQYTFHNNGHDKGIYALRDSQTLQDLNNGHLWHVGIVATVMVKGIEVGHGSCWGYMTDGRKNGDYEPYIHQSVREIAREALRSAKRNLSQLKEVRVA